MTTLTAPAAKCPSLPAALSHLARVPVPSRCAALPRDQHGLPIPFTTAVAPDGAPCWNTLSGHHWQEAVGERLCGLCGQRLSGGVCLFIGGSLCAETHDFVDPPMHEECARYAVHASPHYVLPQSAFEPPRGAAVVGVSAGETKIALFETTTRFREVWRDLPGGRAVFLHARRFYKTEWYVRVGLDAVRISTEAHHV